MAFRGGNENINRKGRPKGATNKPKFSSYLTEEQIQQVVAKAMELALKGNEMMIKLITEQHFGKPVQPLSDPDGGSLSILVSEVVAKKNDIDPQPKSDS